MRHLILQLIIFLFCIPLYLNASIIYVPGNYSTIQSALNAAANGDTILVAPGIYYENVNFRGKGILLASFFINNHDTSYISNTIINGSNPVHPDTASCVIMTKSNISFASDTSAGIIGFTLTGGSGTVWNDNHYPGNLYREGGGIFIQYWSPRIRYNRIIGNHIDNDPLHPDGGGGAVRCGDGYPLIENNVIQNNSAHCGTAINLYFSSGIIRNNIIAGNYGGHVWGAGAIYTYNNCLQYPILIENNTVIYNSSINGCGGLRLYLSNSVTVKNNIVWGNLPIQIFITGGIVSLSYCNVQGGWSGTGNIDANPLFINNSFYLSQVSPCIDAGDTSASYKDPEDPLHPGLALWPALGTIRNDMGVFGGPHCSVIGSSIIGIKKYGKNQIISDFILFQNYPNPFNPGTMIKFQIKESGFVSLKVYDILGKEVAILVNENLKEGTYEIPFNISQNNNNDLTSGIYFYKLEINNNTKNNYNFIQTKKMIFIK